METWVHACTEMHRALVDALSYPGERVDFNAQSIENPFTDIISNEFLLIAKTLLDREVSYAVVAEKSQDIAKALTLMTGAKACDSDCADYVFLLQKIEDQQFDDLVVSLKRGDLVDPHHSATLIVDTAYFSQSSNATLSGPGIEFEKITELPLNKSFYDSRLNIVSDFPMGIDIIFIEANSKILALPRTTKVEVR